MHITYNINFLSRRTSKASKKKENENYHVGKWLDELVDVHCSSLHVYLMMMYSLYFSSSTTSEPNVM